jgi:Tfp pilus assembly protein PilX
MIWEDSMFHPLRNQDGIAMIIALMIMLMLTIIGLGIVK